jgi:complex iron-sulfur molybdoenzyme family reductase subunit alpha
MVHGEYDEVAKKHFGEELVKENKKKILESIDKKWFPIWPKPGKDPKALFLLGDNLIARLRSNEHAIKTLIPKYDLIVEMNIRYSSTSFYSDYVLPSSDHHEKIGMMFYSIFPFFNALTPGQKAQGESKSDWGIFKLLVKHIEKAALKRGVKSYNDKELNDVVNFETLYEDFIEGGKVEKEEEIMDTLLKASIGINDPDAKERTYKEFSKKGHYRTMPNGDPEYDNEFPDPVATLRWHTRVQKKWSWPTLTGRQQFYIDHPTFLELGEELPVHKDMIGSKNFPYVFNTPHNRWGIHTSWRFEKDMLRLNRGEPMIYVSPEIAKTKGLEDWDKVKVFNDVGDFKVRVKITSFLPPHMVFMYHAWERFQFEDWKSFQAVVPTYLKPTNIVSDYGHLKFRFEDFDGGLTCKDVTVDLEKI